MVHLIILESLFNIYSIPVNFVIVNVLIHIKPNKCIIAAHGN